MALSKGYIEEELEKVGYKAEVVYFQQAGPALNEALATNKIDVAMYGGGLYRSGGVPWME